MPASRSSGAQLLMFLGSTCLLRRSVKRKDNLDRGLDVHGLPVDPVGLELPLLYRIDRRGLQQRGSAEGLDPKDFPARIDDGSQHHGALQTQKSGLLVCEGTPHSVLPEGELDGTRRTFGRKGNLDPEFPAGPEASGIDRVFGDVEVDWLIQPHLVARQSWPRGHHLARTALFLILNLDRGQLVADYFQFRRKLRRCRRP